MLQIIPIDNPLPVSIHILSMHSREYLLVHTFMLFTFACFICRPIPLYLPAVRRVEWESPKLSTRAGPSRRLFSFSFSFSVFVISAHADADAKRLSLFWSARQLLLLPLPLPLAQSLLLLLDAVAPTSLLRQLARIAVGWRRLVRVLRCARTRVDYGRRAQICLTG